MTRGLRRLALGIFLAGCGLVGPAVAAEERPLDDSLKMFEDAAAQIMKALELMILAVPQYEAPQMLDNGDILIRRVKPREPTPPREPGGTGGQRKI